MPKNMVYILEIKFPLKYKKDGSLTKKSEIKISLLEEVILASKYFSLDICRSISNNEVYMIIITEENFDKNNFYPMMLDIVQKKGIDAIDFWLDKKAVSKWAKENNVYVLRNEEIFEKISQINAEKKEQDEEDKLNEKYFGENPFKETNIPEETLTPWCFNKSNLVTGTPIEENGYEIRIYQHELQNSYKFKNITHIIFNEYLRDYFYYSLKRIIDSELENATINITEEEDYVLFLIMCSSDDTKKNITIVKNDNSDFSVEICIFDLENTLIIGGHSKILGLYYCNNYGVEKTYYKYNNEFEDIDFTFCNNCKECAWESICLERKKIEKRKKEEEKEKIDDENRNYDEFLDTMSKK